MIEKDVGITDVVSVMYILEPLYPLQQLRSESECRHREQLLFLYITSASDEFEV